MKYIIYSRVSTKQQVTDTQLQECINYVNQRKTDKDQIIHFDEPETSSRIPMERRVKLSEMLNAVKSGDTVVVYKLDRLARDGEELVYIYRSKLTKKGINVVSLYEPHVDKANIHIYAFLSETERENIRIRTKSALKAKQNRMEKAGTTWYGFKTDPEILQLHRDRARSYNKPYKLIPDLKEFEACNLMIQWHKEGLSYQQIADELNAQGYANQSGKPLQKMTVYRVVQRKEMYNPALVG